MRPGPHLQEPQPPLQHPPAARRAVVTALALALAACGGGGPEPAPVYDLGEELAFARVIRESREILPGSQQGVALLSGWSHPEIEPRSGLGFRWGLAPASELQFTVIEPRALSLRIEARPSRTPGDAPRAVELLVNGRPAGRLELHPGWQEHELEIAGDLLRRGANRLRLGYGTGAPVATAGAGEERPIAVAWYRLALLGPPPTDGPAYDAERGLLFLPWGSRLDYYLRAPEGGVVRAPRRRFTGGPGLLTVDLERDGAPGQRLAAVSEPGPLELELPAEPGEPVRLSFAAVATASAAAGGGVALETPEVWAAARPEEAPPEAAASGGRRDGELANVLIYLVDTLRADRLGCYGHPRPVSPRIDRFAAGATLFENARANAPWTLPAVASVMTGLWPPAHGVFEGSRRLAPASVTLAEVLAAAGYQTAAIVTNGFATGAYGLDQGFDELTLIDEKGRKSHLVHEAAVEWLERRDRERPFFLYLHTIDPHKPYLPAEPQRRRFAAGSEEIWRRIVANPRQQVWEPSEENVAQLLDLYDAEIAENDASFGDTLDALAAAGLYDEALIVFLSDHGEEFHEHHSWTHASNLFREVLNVPLIVKLPGQSDGRRVAEPVQQIDLMPTLLAYLGVEAPPTQGRPLPGILAAEGAGRAPIFSHTRRDSQTTASIIDGDWKLVRRVDERGVTERLFDWRSDPFERRDLAAERPVLSGLLATEIARHIAASAPPELPDAVPDEAVMDNLRALGYVD